MQASGDFGPALESPVTIGVDQEVVFAEMQAKSIVVCRMLGAQWTVCVRVQGSPADGGTWTTRMAEALEGGSLPRTFPSYPSPFVELFTVWVRGLSSPNALS